MAVVNVFLLYITSAIAEHIFGDDNGCFKHGKLWTSGYFQTLWKKLVGAEPSPCCSFAHHLTNKKWWSIAHLLITKHSPENYAPWLKKHVFCYWRAGAGEKYFLRTSSRHRISRYREIIWLSNRVFVQYIHHLESRWRNSHVVSCSGLSWPLTKPPFGSCAIYIFCSYMFNVRIYIYTQK